MAGSEYEKLAAKAKTFGINMDAVLDEVNHMIQNALIKYSESQETKIRLQIKDIAEDILPSEERLAELVASKMPVPDINLEDLVNRVVSKIPNNGAVEEARISKEVRDEVEKSMLATLDKFKTSVAEKLKEIQAQFQVLIQEEIAEYKTDIIKEVNKKIVSHLEEISEKTGSGSESKIDRYLPFIEKLMSGEKPQGDPIDTLINQAQKWQQLQAIFGGHAGPDPNVVYNNNTKVFTEALKLMSRAKEISPKVLSPSNGRSITSGVKPSVSRILSQI